MEAAKEFGLSCSTTHRIMLNPCEKQGIKDMLPEDYFKLQEDTCAEKRFAEDRRVDFYEEMVTYGRKYMVWT